MNEINKVKVVKMVFDWDKISIQYEDALKAWKTKFGAEIIEAILSIPDTATFIEFIYEEACQTALFALYNAIRAEDKETARAILDYIKLELLPDAVNFVAFWGNLAPHTKTCFQRFFEAVDYATQAYEQVIALMGREEGTLTVYANIDEVTVYVDGEEKGTCGSATPLKITLPVGSHGVEGVKSKYYPAVRQVYIDRGEYQTLKLVLHPIEEENKGTLIIYSDEPDTRIYIEGEYYGMAGPTTPVVATLPYGTYDVEGQKEGYRTAVKHPYVPPGETTVIMLDMVKLD